MNIVADKFLNIQLLIKGVMGVPIMAFLSAIALRLGTKFFVKAALPYWSAYKVAILAGYLDFFGSFLIGFLWTIAGGSSGGAVLFGLIASIPITAYLYGILIKSANGLKAGFSNGMKLSLLVKVLSVAVLTALIATAILLARMPGESQPTASSGPYPKNAEDEQAQKRSWEADGQNILTWNQKQEGQFSVTLATLELSKVKTLRNPIYNPITVTGLGFEDSTIENKTTEKIVGVVVVLGIFNKDATKLVLKHRLVLETEIFPTGKVRFHNKTFVGSGYEDDSAIDEIDRAAKQLDGNWSWNWHLVAVIPESLQYVDLRHALGVESTLREQQDSKR